MEAISRRKFLKAIFKKSLVLITVFAVIFSSLGPLTQNIVPAAKAAITGVEVTTIGLPNQNPGSPIGQSSPPMPIAKIIINTNAAQTLTSIGVAFGGTGFVAGDLAALDNANASSGVALYNDAGNGNTGYFGTGDQLIPLAGLAWSGTNALLTPASAANLSSGSNIYYIVIRTSSGATNNHTITASIAQNGVVTNGGNGPSSAGFLTNEYRVDATALSIVSATGAIGSPTINVRFSKPVQKVGGGSLVAASFTISGGKTISTVSHNPGMDFATLTLSVNLVSGDFTPTPTTIAAASTAIADMGGNVLATTPVNLVNAPVIITAAIATAIAGTVYSPLVTLTAAGGTGTLSWVPFDDFAAAALTNFGLVLNSNGTITGTAANPGSAMIKIKVTDSASPPVVGDKIFSINVTPSGGGGIPGISNIAPAGGAKGASNVSVAITGTNTHFTTASTVEFLLNGTNDTNITIGARTSSVPTNLTFPITLIASGAVVGSRDVRVTTSGEIVTMPNGFNVFTSGGSGLNLFVPGSNATSVPLPPNFNFSTSNNSAINSYRITVNSASDFSGTTLWDYAFPKIGGPCDASSCNVGYGAGQFLILTQPIPLNPNTAYYWRVRTYAEQPIPSISSATAVETTGISGFTTTASVTDTMPPNIQHRPVFQAKASTDLNVIARVMDNMASAASNPALAAKIYYCSGSANNTCTPTYANDADHNGTHLGAGFYRYVIPSATIGAANTETRYYLEASDGANTSQFKGISGDPFRVTSVAGGTSNSITGNIKDTAATPNNLAGAYVFAEGTGFLSAVTETNGNFTLGSGNTLFAGTYDIVAFKEGYADRRMDGIPAGTQSNINFQLGQGGGGGFGGDTTRPRVKFTGPMDGTSGSPGNDSNFRIFAVFDKAMSQTAVTTAGNLTVNVVNSSTGELTPITANGTWTYYTTAPAGGSMLPPEANMAAWTLTSPNILGDNKTIAVVISSNVTDTAGNAIQGNQSSGNYVFSFTTGSTANFTGFISTTGTFSGGGTFGSGAFMPPHVNGTNPAPGSFDVYRNAKLVVNFSDPMADDGGSYTLASNIKLFTVSGTTEAEVTSSAINTVTLDTTKMNATVNLKTTYNAYNSVGSFAAGAKYRLKVLGGAKAASGMTIAPPDQITNPMFIAEFTFRDKTVEADEFDSGAPTVVGSYPNTGDTNVPTTLGAVNVAFSKDMDTSTLTSSTFYLSVGSTAINGTVEYRALERQAFFMPKSALSSNTTYTINVTTSVKAANGTAITTAVARTFTTGAADITAPTVSFVSADDYNLAITFSKPMNSASATDTLNFASSVLKPANLALAYDAPGFTAPGIIITIPADAAFSYDAATNTLSVQKYNSVVAATLQDNKEILVTVSNVKDIGGVAIAGGNTARAPIKNSSVTKGALGPMAMSGSAFDMGGGFTPTNFSSTTFGFAPPVEVQPFNKMAGQTTIYGVRIPISKKIPAGGTIVLTFPTGFDVSGAKQDINSPMRTDLNGPGDGTINFKCLTSVTGGKSCPATGGATVTGDTSGGGDDSTRGGLADDGVIVNSTSRAVTIYLSAATRDQYSDTHDFLTIDIAGIKNSTVPKDFNTSGYTVDVKTKNGTTVLESLTSMPFFIQGATGTTYTLGGTITAASVTGGTMKVYLMSPMTGPMEQEITFSAGGTAAYSFAGLPSGGYGLFTDQFISLSPSKDFVGRAFPENLFITANKTYDFELASAASGTSVTVTVTGPVGENIDVFASSPSGFRVKQQTLTGAADAVVLKLPDGQWYVGVGPQMPKGPMSGPPPSPNYLPPKPFEVKVANSSCTIDGASTCAKAITLSTSAKQIRGLVQDGTGKTMANAQVFAYSPQGGFGTNAQTDSSGSFTLRVSDGIYTVGAFIPGMPPSKEVSVTITSDTDTYLLISGAAAAITPEAAATSFVLKVAKPDYTISGKVTDGTNVVQGASVYAYRINGPGGANAITDSSGNYTLYVSAGTWKVGTFLPQYGNLTELNVTVSAANVSNQNFAPSQTGTFRKVSGKVTSGGADVSGAFVTIRNSTTSNEAITATDGTYSFNVPVGTGYIVKANIPGVGETVPLTAFPVEGADIPNVNIVSAAARTVTITFTTAPVKASVELSSATGVKNRVEIANTTTGTLTVPDGNYTVQVDVPGAAINLATAIASGSVAFNATTGIAAVTGTGGLTITMPTMRTLTGTVKVGAANLADAWVEIFDPANGGVHFGAKADASGAFTIKVADGTYKINAMKPGYYRDPSTLIVNASTGAQTITVAAASTTIEGTIYIGSAGAANAFVRAEKQGGGFSGAQADANGVYKLYVTSGIWRVYAVAEGYAEAAYASNPIDVTNASVTGKNITVSTAVNVAAPKSKSITPASGGTLEDTATGIKLTFPATALGSSTSSGNVEAKETNNVRETSTAKPLKNFDSTTGTYINSGKTITATVVNSSGSSTAVTTLSQPVTIEMTYTKEELAATASAADSSINTKAEADAVKMGYWDESTASWVTQPTTITYKDASGNVITDVTTIDTAGEFATNVLTVIISATTDHLSLYAPVSTVGTTPPSTPSDLAATAASSSQINLAWTQTSGATSYDIYRNTAATGTFTRIGSEPTVSSGSTTAYSDSTGLSANTAYYYKITSLNATGESAASTNAVSATTNAAPSGGGGGGGGTVTPATIAPTNGSVSINTGASAANSQTVTLTISATNAISMAISNTSDFSNATWETYANTKSWNLTDGVGTKTVYVKFRNSAGDSQAYSDTITYDPNAVITPATPTPTSVPPIITPPATSYPDGTLLKSATDPKVYVIKDGEKVWIETAAKFNAAGYKWTEVKTVSAEVIKQVGVVTLLRAEGDPRVYVVKNNIKRHIASAADFKTAGYSWSDVQVVAKSQVDAYSEAAAPSAAPTLIRAAGDYKVYVVENNTKRWIKTAEEFRSANYDWKTIQEVALSALAAYPEAAAVIIKVVNTPTLRVRASNTTTSGILGKVSQNETFAIIEEKNGWYKIKTKTGVTGWISGAYAKK